jgi:hypothetical protein
MKRLIYSTATTALLAAIATIGFTPASAMITHPIESFMWGRL